MTRPLQTVNEFLELTNTHHDVQGAAQLMHENIRFTGPALRISGVDEYVGLLEQFLSSHVGWKIHEQFENGNDACIVGEIVVQSPKGEMVTLELAEWFKVSDGKISEHRVYYDPRDFNAAFGIE